MRVVTRTVRLGGSVTRVRGPAEEALSGGAHGVDHDPIDEVADGGDRIDPVETVLQRSLAASVPIAILPCNAGSYRAACGADDAGGGGR
jgi:hypothetical protein